MDLSVGGTLSGTTNLSLPWTCSCHYDLLWMDGNRAQVLHQLYNIILNSHTLVKEKNRLYKFDPLSPQERNILHSFNYAIFDRLHRCRVGR